VTTAYKLCEMTELDIPGVIDLVKVNWADSRYRDLTFDDEGAYALLHMSLTSPSEQVFILLDGTQVIGAIGALVVKMPWFKQKFASEQVFTIHPDHRGYKQAMLLLRAYKAWATERGAVLLTVSVDHGKHDERVAKLYERAGFRQNGYSLAARA
jgi:GNAT superfamily N-acetyltransferase